MKHLLSQPSWVVVSTLALLLTLMLTSGTAHAAQPEGGESVTSIIVRGTVNFTVPADICAELPAGVSLSGTGTRFQVITTKSKPDGSRLIMSNDFVIGTATDSNSNTYQFVYANQDRNQVPKNGAPIKVNMTDAFVLTGNGGSNNYTVAFNWTWTYSPPEGEWPPVHNWNQNLTNGDPLTCDPL